MRYPRAQDRDQGRRVLFLEWSGVRGGERKRFQLAGKLGGKQRESAEEASSPNRTPKVAGPERSGRSSILIPSSILAQFTEPRFKQFSSASGPAATSMGRKAGYGGEGSGA